MSESHFDGSLPVPASVRLRLVAVPVLVVAALWLVARAPGAGNTCVAKGIATAGREGICQREANLFGAGVTFNVVDAGHVLHMPGYDAQLLSTAARVTPISDPAQGLRGPTACPANVRAGRMIATRPSATKAIVSSMPARTMPWRSLDQHEQRRRGPAPPPIT